MQNLTGKARIYIWITLFLGSALLYVSVANMTITKLWLLLMMCAFAGVAQILKVEGATSRSSYQISWIAYGFTFVLFGAPETMLVIAVAHLAEWLWYQYPWYIQSFNLASYAVVVSVSKVIMDLVIGGSLPSQLGTVLGFLVAALFFTLLNHFMVGLVIFLARGESFGQSGVFNLLTLMIDFIVFSMGAAAAFIWLVNPFASALILSPLYLIYTTLRVPALEHQTRTDPKTGIYNARYFSEALSSELTRASRFSRPMTVVMADVDHLRNINNSYGHIAGDIVLGRVAEMLRDSVREFDIVARFGGEEFAILMPETSVQQALPVVEQIRRQIEAMQIEVTTSVTPLSVTVCFGVAEREYVDQSADELVHCADLAMYEAKARSRNLVCYYSYGDVKVYTNRALDPDPIPAQPISTQLIQTRPDVSNENENQEVPKRSLDTPARPIAIVKSANNTSPKVPVEPASKPQLPKTRPAWWLTAYIYGMAAVVIVLLLISVQGVVTIDPVGIITFAILALVTEWLSIMIHTENVSVSTSVAPLIAGACIFGAAGVVAVSVILGVATFIKYHSPTNRLVFNTSNHLLAGLLSASFVTVSGLSITGTPSFSSAFVVLIATMITYLSTTVTISIAVSLDHGTSISEVWKERFGWLWPHYLALGVISYSLAIGYLSSGVVGVAVILVPLMLVRISQTQYIRRTETIVNQLRSANEELTQHSQVISDMNDGLILALSYASDLRDPHVQGHAQHVARYAIMIAEAMNVPAERLDTIRRAGLLHDIGKIGIPETILFKPSKLTPDEYAIIKQHVNLGADLINEIESLQHLAPFIRHHHERYDGRGYPDGLAGEEIPLEARIINAADAIEAMASDRPYQKARSVEVILHELQAQAGTQFDPKVVAAFTRVIEEKGTSIIVNSASYIIESHLHREYELSETLLRIAGTLNSTLQQERVLNSILEQLARVVNYDNASIMLLNGDVLTSAARRSIHTLESLPFSVQTDSVPHIRQVLETRQPVIISDTQLDERWLQRSGSEAVRCWLGIPLIAHDDMIGLLNLSISSPGYYTNRHTSVTTAFAAHAAAAIENARLYAQAQAEIEERKRAQEDLQIERSSLAQKVSERTSELTLSNNDLKRALHAKDEFLANVSHELRTPLSAVLMLTESMREGIYGAIQPKQSDVLRRVHKNGRHLLSLINDILDLSKIEAGTFAPILVEVSVPTVCQYSMQMIQEAAQQKRIRIHHSIDPFATTVLADERRLSQILINLLSNAVKFTNEGGDIGLDVEGDVVEKLLKLTVWDTGIGISSDDQYKLFQPFVQLDSRLSKQYEGTGLGLALAFRLAKLHNGTITLQSEVGVGTRFTVTLPWMPPDNFIMPVFSDFNAEATLEQIQATELVSEYA